MDQLTGVYNRNEVIEQINEELYHHNGGALIIADIQNFTNVNVKFGYRIGDEVLKEFARILQYMFSGTAVIGRLGGDVFAVFVRNINRKDAIERKADQLRIRVEQMELNGLKISLRLGTAVREDYDRFPSLFKRVAGHIPLFKSEAEEQLEQQKSGVLVERDNKEIYSDMRRIKADLDEEDLRKGAYCQNYDYFKMLYRFEKRILERSCLNVYAILVTLTDHRGDLVFFEIREPLMVKLKEMIEANLRRGDAFTQYSSSQYIIMAVSEDHESVELIGERLKETFKSVGSSAVLRYAIHSMEEKRKQIRYNH